MVMDCDGEHWGGGMERIRPQPPSPSLWEFSEMTCLGSNKLYRNKIRK